MTEIATVSTETDESTEGGTPGTPEQENGSESRADKVRDDLAEARDRYRSERDQARAKVEALQLREVDRLAAELAQPGDLLQLGGVSLADLLTEAGDVDEAAVAEAVAALLESRPGLAKNPVPRYVDMSQGRNNDHVVHKAQPTFATLLKS